MRIPTVEELTRGMSEAEARQHIRDIERLIDQVFAMRRDREAFQDASKNR